MQPNATLEMVRSQVHQELENKTSDRSWLLIFDNEEKGGSILITSRDEHLWDEDKVILVPPMTNEETCDLLVKETKQAKSSLMEALAKKLEGIPLAIRQ